MVARIRTGKSINRVLQYNEQKLRQQHAELLGARNFIVAASNLTGQEKLGVFKKLMSLNERTTTNALHVSLNFDPSENFSNERLLAIASDYMKGIGFADQPYLVYKHSDSGHPHIHIVSTNIRWDGSRIAMHNLGRTKSEETRKVIEEKYSLVPAEYSKRAKKELSTGTTIAIYGKETTKQAVSRIVSLALGKYKPASLDELKAVLSLYHIGVIEARKQASDKQQQGLSYVVLDALSKPLSAPIKASALSNKPTLKNISKNFTRNEQLREANSESFHTKLKSAFVAGKTYSFETFEKRLRAQGIAVRVAQGRSGEIKDMVFVDHRSGFIWKGENLLPDYCWKTLLVPSVNQANQSLINPTVKHADNTRYEKQSELVEKNNPNALQPIETGVPYPWRKPKKKKRKRING